MARTKERDLLGSSFYNTNYWKNGDSFMLNSILSTTLALMSFFDKALFVKDNTRVIYASNAYAFRARSMNSTGEENSEFQQLNLPFMNLSVTQGGISLQSTRLYSSYEAKTSGIYIEDIGKKVSLLPMEIRFEGTYFTTQMADAQLAITRLFRLGSSELILQPSLWYNDVEIKNIAKVYFDDIVLDDQYQESDWLERNRIHTVGVTISVSTYLLDIYPGAFTEEDDITGEGSDSRYWNVRKVLFYWALRNNLDSWNGNDFDDWAEGIVDHVDQEVYWHKMPDPEISVVAGRVSKPRIEAYQGYLESPDILRKIGKVRIKTDDLH